MSLGLRLKQARHKKKLTQEELAEIVGIKQQAVQRIEAEKVKSTSYVVQLAQALDVTPEWLALGTEAVENKTPSLEIKTAPLIQWTDYQLISHLPIQNPDLTKIAYTSSNSQPCFALQINNTSMSANTDDGFSFLPGDIIIVDPQRQAKDNDFVIAKVTNSNAMVFRRLTNNKHQLDASSSQYKTIVIDDSVHLCGVVTVRYSNFDN